MMSILVLCALPALALGGLVGAPVDIDLKGDDPNVQFAVGAINDFYTQLGDAVPRTLVKIESAQSQVVSGTLYHLVLRVTSGGQEELCKVNVWSRPWLSANKATQVTADPACKAATDAVKTDVGASETDADSSKLVGGETAIDPNTQEVQDALSFAVTSYNGMENYAYMRKAVQVGKVTSQVVAGIAYHFYDVQLATTDCAKNTMVPDMSVCNVVAGANVQTCSFDVIFQAWMTPQYTLNNLKC